MADSEPPAKKPRVRKSILTASEKKRRKRERGRALEKTRITLGATYERWCRFKEEEKISTDRAVAERLLDHWYARKTESRSHGTDPVPSTSSGRTHKFSTPVSVMLPPIEERTPSVSEISEVESEREQQMSGVEEVSTSGTEEVKAVITEQPVEEQATTSTGRKFTKKTLTESFVDPFNLSIEVSDEIDSEEDDTYKDEDYELSFCLTAVLPKEVTDVTEDVAFEEVEFNFESDEDMPDTEDMEESMSEEGVTVISSEDECHKITSMVKCLVFMEQLLTLSSYAKLRCTQCESDVYTEQYFVGSAVYIKWICHQKHNVHEWCSQPLLNRKLHSGDFLIASTILTSGNNFNKMLLWAKQLNLKFVPATRFHNIQRCYVLPAIDKVWGDNLEEVRAEFKDKEIVLMGDGRNDSPGHSAQYCSYTLMEYETKKIVALHTIDKRETERKSVNMEKKGFIGALNEVKRSGLSIAEVVTDAHTGIAAVMRKDYPEMKHSFDIWHVAKNLGKKIIKIHNYYLDILFQH